MDANNSFPSTNVVPCFWGPFSHDDPDTVQSLFPGFRTMLTTIHRRGTSLPSSTSFYYHRRGESTNSNSGGFWCEKHTKSITGVGKELRIESLAERQTSVFSLRYLCVGFQDRALERCFYTRFCDQEGGMCKWYFYQGFRFCHVPRFKGEIWCCFLDVCFR